MKQELDYSKETTTEAKLMELARKNGAPLRATHERVTVQEKIEKKLERIVEGITDKAIDEVMSLTSESLTLRELDQWSKIVARMNTSKNVKVDTNITAMGILGMFPVMVTEEP